MSAATPTTRIELSRHLHKLLALEIFMALVRDEFCSLARDPPTSWQVLYKARVLRCRASSGGLGAEVQFESRGDSGVPLAH